MSRRSLFPCRARGCSALVNSPGYCVKHQPMADAASSRVRRKAHDRYNKRRGETAAWYKTTTWKHLRASVLRERPLCSECEAKGRVTPAKLVDHIVPVVDAPDRMYDATNLQPLCQSCHNRKTADERKGRGA